MTELPGFIMVVLEISASPVHRPCFSHMSLVFFKNLFITFGGYNFKLQEK